MVELEPHQKCPFRAWCEHRSERFRDIKQECSGVDPSRTTIFICELWAENYEGESKWDQTTVFN